jgi:hypothetical protein
MKHFAMLGQNSVDAKTRAVTHLVVVQIETSLESLIKPTEINSNDVVTYSYITKAHLRADKPHRVARLLLDVI